MGAWGSGPFENDDAADWTYDLERTTDLTLVRSALAAVADHVGYVEAPDGSIALAAATVIDAIARNAQDNLSDTVRRWAIRPGVEVATTDVELAARAVTRILAPDSELRTLWAEGASPWLVETRALLGRLAATNQ